MDEKVELRNGEMLIELLTRWKEKKVLRRNHWKLYAMSHDSGKMFHFGVSTTLAEIEQIFSHS